MPAVRLAHLIVRKLGAGKPLGALLPTSIPRRKTQKILAQDSTDNFLRMAATKQNGQITGEVTRRLYADGGVFAALGKFRQDAIDLEIGHCFERLFSIQPDGPYSAKATMTQSLELGRGEWHVKIDAGAQMTSTVTTFELKGWIDADRGSSVCRRQWEARIPRPCI
jgi:hypothetical protein